MSMESAKKFMEALGSDGGALGEKIDAAIEGYTGDPEDRKAWFEAVVVPIAKEAGYEVTWEEIEEIVNAEKNKEMSMGEMKSVAGGSLTGPNLYWAKYWKF